MLDRRLFLQLAGVGVAAALLDHRAAFAAVPTDKRLVLVFLRGGLDGLHVLAPYADADYRRLRPTLALRAPGDEGAAIDLDGYFGMHPALSALLDLYQRRELLFVPASTTRYRARSHFDGQNMLENGSGKPYGAGDGWLNRAITHLHGGDERLGLALGPVVPLILQGDARVQTWAKTQLPGVDEDFLTRLARTYTHDPLFARALQDARGSTKPSAGMGDLASRTRPSEQFALSAAVAGELLARADGPRIAVMELQGWDTHFDQQRRLGQLLGELSDALLSLRKSLGVHWSRTAVVVVSEFGRTAAENSSRGTDHGTGGLALLAGGAVAGGRIAGAWPGLGARALFEGRDLRAVNDYEGIFKSLLISHLGLTPGFVDDVVFPGSGSVKPMDGLLHDV